MRTIKAGVIGVGSMGQHHVRIYSQMPGVQLVGIADSSPDALDAISEEFGVKGYAHYPDLLDQDLDAVSIALPTSIHKEAALAAINRKKHVLIEKPIAEDSASARVIIGLAEKNNIKLMIGHVERFNPVIQAIKNSLTGEEIISIDITRVGPLPPRINDVGIIIDLAIHDIDIIRYITGSEVDNVFSVYSKVRRDHEETAMILLKMKNGIMAHITTNWLTPFKARSIQIATKTKFIKGDFITQKAQEYSHFTYEDNSYLVKELPIPFAEPLRCELESFIKSIQNDTGVTITGVDGLEALIVAERCLEV